LLDKETGPSSPCETEDARRFAQLSFADLGWRTLRNDPSARASMPPVDASLTFVHPDLGVALVDVAPARAADPVERLRRRLEALHTRPALAAELPIVYLPLTTSDLWRLNLILDSAFASPALPSGEGKGWVDVVQQALLPESFPPAPVEPEPAAARSGDAEARAVKQSRPLRLWMLCGAAAVLLGGAVVYGIGAPGWQPAPAPPGVNAGAEAVQPEKRVEAGAGLAVPAGALRDAATPPAVADPIRPVPAAPALAPKERPVPEATMAAQTATDAGATRLQEPGMSAGLAQVASSPKRILVHAVAARHDAAETLIRAAAHAHDEVELRMLRTTLDIAVVRYFHHADQAAAEGLAQRLGPAWRVQDFTRYRPRPQPDTLEVWLPRFFRTSNVN
jgi:hypothetical protein